jgi:ATPase subunit of ABC transporter with duplicated ATPase domains
MVATHVVEVKDGAIRHYPGTYQEYVYHLEYLAQRELDGTNQNKERESREKEKVEIAPADNSPSDNKTAYLRRKELRSALTKVKTRLKKIEDDLAALGREKSEIEQWFADNLTEWSKKKSERLTKLGPLIEKDEEAWLIAHGEKEDVESELKGL